MKKINNHGIMMMEIVAYIVCLGIILAIGFQFIRIFNANLNRGITRANTATTNLNNTLNQYATVAQLESAKTKWFWVDVPVLNQCKKADAQYWIARTANRVVTLYTNSTCTSSIGTLNATDNSRFTNKNTKTLWEVSGDTATLTVQLIVFP